MFREGFARFAMMYAAAPNRNDFVPQSDCGEAEDVPREVIDMHAFHHHNDRTGSLVVKTRQQRVGEPLVGRRPFGLGERVVRFEWIVDLAAPTG
jgi:hypothetical protein